MEFERSEDGLWIRDEHRGINVFIPEEIMDDCMIELEGIGRGPLNKLTFGDFEETPSENRELLRADMPGIPSDQGLETQTDENFYDRLVGDPDSQPARYRRKIRAYGQVTGKEFDSIAEKLDYNPGAGAHNASLLMLERIGEVEREGRGGGQVIRWIGE